MEVFQLEEGNHNGRGGVRNMLVCGIHSSFTALRTSDGLSSVSHLRLDSGHHLSLLLAQQRLPLIVHNFDQGPARNTSRILIAAAPRTIRFICDPVLGTWDRPSGNGCTTTTSVCEYGKEGVARDLGRRV